MNILEYVFVFQYISFEFPADESIWDVKKNSDSAEMRETMKQNTKITSAI